MYFDPDVLRMFEAAKEKNMKHPDQVPIQQARQTYRELLHDAGGPMVPMESVQDLKTAGEQSIPLRLYRPLDLNKQPAPCLIFIHGGGYVVGDLDSHDGVCRRLASRAECMVIAIDYRLAPEHPAPAASEDISYAVRWIAENAATLGIDAQKMAICGDSAGGGLTAVATVFAREASIPLRLQVLLYPSIDNRTDPPAYSSRTENKEVPPLTPDTLAWATHQYLPDPQLGNDWRQSPILIEDKTNLPPALLMVGERDPLNSEGLAYGEALQQAGVPVKSIVIPGMVHGFITMSCKLGVTERALDVIAAEFRRTLEAGTAGSAQK